MKNLERRSAHWAKQTLLFLSILWAPRIVRAQSACLPADTVRSLVLQHVISLFTATDTATANSRTFLHLPTVTATDISIVTDTVVCRRIANTLAAHTPGGDANPAAWVFRISWQGYVAFNFRQAFANRANLFYLDPNGVKMSQWAF
jgi:hypothetical protein